MVVVGGAAVVVVVGGAASVVVVGAAASVAVVAAPLPTAPSKDPHVMTAAPARTARFG